MNYLVVGSFSKVACKEALDIVATVDSVEKAEMPMKAIWA